MILHFCICTVNVAGVRAGSGVSTSDEGLYCNGMLRYFGANACEIDMSLAFDASDESLNDIIKYSDVA